VLLAGSVPSVAQIGWKDILIFLEIRKKALKMIRSFVAIDLPHEIKEALSELGEALRLQLPERSVRWSRVSGIHLTLKFLGDVAEAEVPAIKQSLVRIGQRQSPFSFRVASLGCFPNVKRPRVLWVGVEEETGSLAALQNDVENNLAPLGFEREKRAFHPHLTLGRARRGIAASDQSRLGDVVASAAVGELGQVHVASFHLMRSDLRHDGAVYTSLENISLEA
jgi:2'-5' RNA ligase